MTGRAKRKPEEGQEENGQQKKKKSKYFKAQTSNHNSNSVDPESTSNSSSMMKTLLRDFYSVPCQTLAKALLGKRIVRIIDNQRLSGRIVETEAYLGGEDKASHSHQGKRTQRNEAMFMEPGTAYVYNIYGMYCCLNISSGGNGAAVLIRALEVTEGAEEMRKIRGQRSSKPLKEKDLTNGPSKLCQALQINKNDFNKVDLVTSKVLFLESDLEVDPSRVVLSPRINIGYAEEWTDKPLRFYILGNPFVSVRNKEREQYCQLYSSELDDFGTLVSTV